MLWRTTHTFVVLREKVRAVRKVWDIDGILAVAAMCVSGYLKPLSPDNSDVQRALD